MGARGEPGFVVGFLRFGSGARAGFQLRAGVVHLLPELFAAGDFLGERLGIVVLLIGALGLLEELGDVGGELRAQFLGARVGDVLILGGAGFDVGAVDADGAQLEELEFAGQFEHVHEGGGDGGPIVSAKGAEGWSTTIIPFQ